MAALTSIALFGLKEVLKFAGGRAVAELELIWKFKDELEWMKGELAMIQAVLRDAESRCFQDEHVRLWLAQLRDVCYDIQDMLDPYLLHCTQHSGSRKRVWSFDVSNLPADYALAREMKVIRKKLNDVEERKNRFNFMEHKVLDWHQINKDRETISMLEPVVLGRDEDQNNLVNLILQNHNNDQLLVIPIVGMGGLGKTTLARLVFNDQRLKESNRFDIQEWVYVSTQFDLRDIGRRILQKSDLNSLQDICRELQNKTSGKRCLIVLDDVWNINNQDWEYLMASLKGSSKGSAIVVTTRLENTARAIATTTDPYFLQTLSEDNCLQLFQLRAFKSTSEMDEYPHLVGHGKVIVKKCGGVALVALTLGGILRFQRDEKYWLYVKNSEMRELHDESLQLSISENKVLSSLMLSYNHMPPHLKLCFAYCSMFCKGAEIDTEMLIQHWICLNFISPAADMTAEETARDYLNDLISLSFLQKCQKYPYLKEGDGVVMHDLMHDLAQLVAKDHDIKVITDAEEHTQRANTTPFRYLSLHGIHNTLIFTDIVQQHGKARAIYLNYSNTTLSEESFSQLTCLRVLEVHGYYIYGMSKSIKQLKQLHYFSASCLDFATESFDNLQSLQYLKLAGCYRIKTLHIVNLPNLLHLQITGSDGLKELPECLGDLRNLKYLDLSGCDSLECLPTSISKLVNLERLALESLNQVHNLLDLMLHLICLKHLSIQQEDYPLSLSSASEIRGFTNLETLKLYVEFNVEEEDVEVVVGEEGMKRCCNIVALQGLNMLEGKLTISGLERVKDPKDAEKANLIAMHKLESLELIWNGDEEDEEVGAAVFQSLLPSSSNLWELRVDGYRGRQWPIWMMTDTGYNLEELCLTRIENIALLLQPIGLLRHLQYLSLTDMRNLRKIEVEEIFGGNEVELFPSLKTLWLNGMVHLEEVWLTRFPCLETLYVYDCPRLSSIRTQQPSSITNLSFRGSTAAAVPDLIGEFPSLRDVNIHDCSNIESLPNWIKQLAGLQHLYIGDCREALKEDLVSYSQSSPSITLKIEGNQALVQIRPMQ